MKLSISKIASLPFFLFGLIIIAMAVIFGVVKGEGVDGQLFTTLNLSLIYIVIPAIIMVLSLIVVLALDFKAGMWFVIGVVGLALLFLIGYFTSPSEMPAFAVNAAPDLPVKYFRAIYAGITTFFVLTAVTLVLMVGSMVRGIFQGS